MFHRFLIAIQFIWKGGNDDMAMVYVTLIIKGAKVFADVPATIQAQVKQLLIDLDLGELSA